MRSTTTRRRDVRAGRGSAAKRPRLTRRPLGVESLEGRRVLAASYIYGIDDNNVIQQISTGSQTATPVFNAKPIIGSGLSNAFAYDTDRDQFFFIDSSGNLELWDRDNPATSSTLTTLTNVGGVPANATFYNDAYWYFTEGTNTLNKVSFTYSGTPAVPSVSATDTFTIAGGPTATNNFGDIAVNKLTGILYAATSDGQFYSVNLASPATSYTAITTGNPSLQLSFNSDYSTLYSQAFSAVTYDSVSYNAGQWFTMDLGTGLPTAVSGFAISYTGGSGLRDLGGAASEPAPSLAITKSDGVGTVFAGDGVIHTYEITVTNNGQVAADGVAVTDATWPAGFVQGSVTAPAGTTFTSTGGGNFTWTFDVPLAAGASQTLSVPYTVPFGVAAGPRTNKATVASTGDPETHEATDTNNVVSNALVAGTDLGCASATYVYVINPYAGTPAVAGQNVGVSNEVVARFNAYPELPGFRGGVRVAVGDVDGDNIPDVVTAPGPGAVGKVKVFNLDGTPKAGFTQPYLPFGGSYRDGVEINVGDIDGDGDDDLVAAKSRGPGEVQVAKSSGTAFTSFKSFTAFGGTYRGGATAAIGSQLDANTAAIFVSSGPGMKPTVKYYTLNTTSGAMALVSQFNPVMPAGTAGVSLTTQRFTGGVLDTLVAAGRNGNSKVSAYNGGSNVNIANYSTFSAPAPKNNAPVYAAASSLANPSGIVDTVFMAQGDGGVGTIKKVDSGSGVVNPVFAPVYLGKPVVSPLRIATNVQRVANG